MKKEDIDDDLILEMIEALKTAQYVLSSANAKGIMLCSSEVNMLRAVIKKVTGTAPVKIKRSLRNYIWVG